MKPVLLLFLTPLGTASFSQTPAVRVMFSPLTRAAYMVAKKGQIETKPPTTFPLKKQRGRLVIPTEKGPKIFRDSKLEEDNPDWEKFTYEGYLAQLESHLILHRHYEWAREILVTKSGQQLTLQDVPNFSPDSTSFVAVSAGLEYWANENYIRLYRFRNHTWREVWRLKPKTWEPVTSFWISPTTLLLRKRLWTGRNPGTTYAYARLTLH